MATITKGFLTSEFLTSLIGQVVGFLILAGIVGPESKDQLVEIVANVVGGIIALVSLVSYIKSRTALKQTVLKQPDVTPALPFATSTQ